jgi:major membrane immunogen (membrane-anchored lipoprotein)
LRLTIIEEETMKKIVLTAVIAVLCVAALAAQTYKDGFYFAQDAAYANNQKNQVVIEVKGGKIASANWNILSLNAGAKDLKSIAQASDASAGVKTWATQTAAVEAFLVSSQNVNASSVPGGPSNVKPFFDLVKKAVKDKAIVKGSYAKDGWYYNESGVADEYHTKNTALITVVNGTIVDALWNGILQGMPASVNPSKMITSKAKGYPMTGAKKTWDQQAESTVSALIKAQSPDSLKLKANGVADGISGVSIHIKEYVDVAKAALQGAR